MIISIIGGGKMGSAFARAIAKEKEKILIKKENNINKENNDELLELRITNRREEPLGIDGFVEKKNALEAVKGADVVVLAVKPQEMKALLSELLDELIIKNPIIITMAAGLRTSFYKKEALNNRLRIVRIMPNLALNKGESLTAVYYDHQLFSEEEEEMIRRILSTTGLYYEVSREEDLDLITALSASGIAYLLRIASFFIEEGVAKGLSHDDARLIVAQTLKGAAALLMDESPDELIRKIASKGGTTEEGLKRMNEEKVGVAMKKVIVDTIKKCELLNNEE